MLDSLGREASQEAVAFAAWADGWFTAQLASGLTFEDARRRFNAIVAPAVLSYASAVKATAEADAMLERVR